MKKMIPILFVFALGAVHVGMTLLYLIPLNPLSKYYLLTVRSYMEPVFEQNWNLFAPDPATSSLQIWYRCGHDGTWSPWMDPLAGMVREHQDFRFTYRGKFLYVYQGVIRNVLNTYVKISKEAGCQGDSGPDCLRKVRDGVDVSRSGKTAARFVRDLCRAMKSSSPGGQTYETAEYQVVKVYPKPFSRRHENQSVPPIEFVPFNSVSLGGTP